MNLIVLHFFSRCRRTISLRAGKPGFAARASMNDKNATIYSDGFAITPLSQVTGTGTFSSAVSIRSGQGQGSHDRVYRFTQSFSQQEQALAYAMGEARQWLKSGRPA